MAQGFITIGKPTPAQAAEHEHTIPIKHDDKKAQAIDYSQDITSLSRRLRTLEERNTNMQSRMELVEQNMLSRHKQLSNDIKSMVSEIDELKKEVIEVKDRMLMLIRELQMSAKKEEVAVLKKYLELWEPVNFVTHNEVNELIQEALNKNK